jgi:hypothetical protein
MPSFYKLGTSTSTVIGKVLAIKQFNGNLIVGGDFTTIGGIAASCLARWDGTDWIGIQGGVSGDTPSVNSIEVFNNQIFIAGNFENANGIPVNGIVRLNSNFEFIATDPIADIGSYGPVTKLKIINNKLYAALVRMPNSYNTPLVVWNSDTQSWEETGTDVLYHNEENYRLENNSESSYGAIYDFVEFNGKIYLHIGLDKNYGSCVVYNNRLYASHPIFDYRLGYTTDLVNWNRVGGGFAVQTTNALGYKWNVEIRALHVFDGKLFVGGNFFNVGNHTNGLLGIPTSHMAIWDDNNWTSVGTGVTENRGIYTFEGVEDNTEISAGNLTVGLYVGGQFNKRPVNQSIQKISLYDIFENFVPSSSSFDFDDTCGPNLPCGVRMSIERQQDGCFIEGPPGPPGPQGAPGADGEDGISGTDTGGPVDCNETFNAKIVSSELIDPNASPAKWQYKIRRGYINSNNQWFFDESTQLDAFNMMETNNTTTTAFGFSIESDGQGGNRLSNFPGFSVKPIPNDTILPVTAVCCMPDVDGNPAGAGDIPGGSGGGSGGGSDPNDQPRDTAQKINYFSSPNPIDGECSSVALSGETPFGDTL